MARIAIGILNQNRYNLFKTTMTSLLESLQEVSEPYDLFLWDNGSEPDVCDQICRDFGAFFEDIMFQGENKGIGAGLKGLHEATRQYEFYMHLENDWECMAPDMKWFQSCIEIMDLYPDVGIIKLRQLGDGQYEMQGNNIFECAEFYSPWWLPTVPPYVQTDFLSTGHLFHHAKIERGYTNNPHFLRKSMVQDWQWDDSVMGYGLEEEKTEILPAICGFETAQLDDGFFRHIG